MRAVGAIISKMLVRGRNTPGLGDLAAKVERARVLQHGERRGVQPAGHELIVGGTTD